VSRSSSRSPDRAADGRKGRRDPALDAKIRTSAWLLAGVVVAFYLGYIAWNFMSGPH
jgi:hypothetical protein